MPKVRIIVGNDFIPIGCLVTQFKIAILLPRLPMIWIQSSGSSGMVRWMATSSDWIGSRLTCSVTTRARPLNPHASYSKRSVNFRPTSKPTNPRSQLWGPLPQRRADLLGCGRVHRERGSRRVPPKRPHNQHQVKPIP